MATSANWTVVFEDKKIIKQNHVSEGNVGGTEYEISDDVFWNQSKFLNIWAIHHGTLVPTDEVEYRDDTSHSSFADANLGNIQDFITKWDEAHLSKLQSDWDNDNGDTRDEEGNITHTETEAEKINRIGARPTSYSS